MSLLGTKATLGGVILVAGQLLFSANVQAATEDHIYGGEFCQGDSPSFDLIDHAGGGAYAGMDPVTFTRGYGVITCPIPRFSKTLTTRNTMAVKVSIHDGADTGVSCTLESMPQYNNSFAVSNSSYISSNTTGSLVEKDTTLALTVKPIDALGSYRLLCVLPPNSANAKENSKIYSYEIIETY